MVQGHSFITESSQVILLFSKPSYFPFFQSLELNHAIEIPVIFFAVHHKHNSNVTVT